MAMIAPARSRPRPSIPVGLSTRIPYWARPFTGPGRSTNPIAATVAPAARIHRTGRHLRVGGRPFGNRRNVSPSGAKATMNTHCWNHAANVVPGSGVAAVTRPRIAYCTAKKAIAKPSAIVQKIHPIVFSG